MVFLSHATELRRNGLSGTALTYFRTSCQAAGYARTHGTMPGQNTLIHSPESPDDELKRLHERVAEQAAIIEGQTATIEQMHERIQELEARLAKDSHNSSRPPSSDCPFKKPPPRSRRQPGGRKPGGQLPAGARNAARFPRGSRPRCNTDRAGRPLRCT